MSDLLDRTTLMIIASAFIMALMCILPSTREMLPFYIVGSGLHIGDTLFHELGHTIFGWLFGQPSIPMIFTLFGADQAGGMSMQWERVWFMQYAAFAALAFGCYWVRDNFDYLFIPAVIFTVFIVAMAFSGYHQLVISYMGHGSSILMGGFFLFRAWLYLDSRNEYERWLNALFGFFLTLYNFSFAYGLCFNADARGDYSDHVAFGISHNDFMAMAMAMPGWSVRGIALATMGYCIAMIVGSFILAALMRNSFEEE